MATNKPMTNEQIRIAIATSLSWTKIQHAPNGIASNENSGHYGNAPGDDPDTACSEVPHYDEDLNAMADVERELDNPQRSISASSRPQDHAPSRYLSELARVCGLKRREEMVVSCPDQFRAEFDKALNAGPPFKLPVGVVILSHSIPASGWELLLIRATAAQRAEAYLRAIGKWQ